MRRSLKQKHKKILVACIAASLFFHAVSVFLLEGRSMWTSAQTKTRNGEIDAPWLSYIDKMERDQILKEAFETPAQEGTFSAAIAQKPFFEPIAETEIASSINSLKANQEKQDHFSFFLETIYKPDVPFPENELLASSRPVAFKGRLPASDNCFDLSEHLPKELSLTSLPKEERKSRLFPPPLSTEIAFRAEPLPAPSAVPLTASLSLQTDPSIAASQIKEGVEKPFDKPVDQFKTLPLASFPNIPKLPTLADLETASYSESFDAEIVFLPREEGEGYVFAITLIPRADLDLPRIRQHYTFLIDRSNSIQKDRLAMTKSAVHKAIEELYEDDTFNIIAFDSKMEKLSPVPLSPTFASLASAERFLEKIQLGSFFSAGDLYKPLLQTVPGRVKDDELYTSILLTDGESLVKKNQQRALFYDWTVYNSGRAALFALGMNSDLHLSMLDAAAAFNKGKLIYSPSQRGIKRKLLKLMKTIGSPVAKNLNCKAISRSPNAKIALYPNQMQLPHLYLDQPYVILGVSDTLDDFILFIQGRLKNRWLNIKKTISFLNAKKGGGALKAEWALQRSYNLYGQYILDGNERHLAEAEKLLDQGHAK